MVEGQALLRKMALPYYAHRQAVIAPALSSIAWNMIAFSGFLDLALLVKDLEPPANIVRKIRSFYESYEQIAEIKPILGDLDTLSRNLAHLDKTNTNAVRTFALKLNGAVQALEQFALQLINQLKINDPDKTAEELQDILFSMQEESSLPGLAELLEQQQLELSKMVQLKNLPATTLAKFSFNQQFEGSFQVDRPWLHNWITTDKELQGVLTTLHKNFLHLINLINGKIPLPERRLKLNSIGEDSSVPSHDYRLALKYYYGGTEESVYHYQIFDLLRNLLK